MGKAVRGKKYSGRRPVPLSMSRKYKRDRLMRQGYYIERRDEVSELYTTHPWEPCFVILPKVSCVSGHAWGKAFRRMIAREGRYDSPPYEFQHEYASKKDMVILKVKGDPYEKKD